ncbi:MAG: plasmid stabilization protein [Terracidiphilus sp.]|jgi:plasmid stability protein
MATIVIRNLDESVKRRLKVRAALNGRSMEAEAREALRAVANEAPKSLPEGGLGTAIHELFAPLGGVELPILPRGKSHRPIPTFS